MVVPSLPEKNVYKTESFIKSRMRGLNLFLMHISQIPYLRSDVSVLAFVSIQDDTEWEAAKKQTGTMDDAGEGHLRWMRALRSCALPNNVDRILLDIKQQIEPLEKQTQVIYNAAKKLAEKSAGVSKEMKELCTGLQQWHLHEMNCIDGRR